MSAYGYGYGLPMTSGRLGGGGGLDPDAQAILAEMDPPLSPFLAKELESRIRELKSGPINGTNTLDSIDFLFPIMFSREEDAENSLINWRDPSHRAVVYNSPIYTPGPDGSWAGDGIDAWIEWHQESNSSWGSHGLSVKTSSAVQQWILAGFGAQSQTGVVGTETGRQLRYGSGGSVAVRINISGDLAYDVISRGESDVRYGYRDGALEATSERSDGDVETIGMGSFVSPGGGTFYDVGVSWVHSGPELPLTAEQVADLNEIRKRWQMAVHIDVLLNEHSPRLPAVWEDRVAEIMWDVYYEGLDSQLPFLFPVSYPRAEDEDNSLINWSNPSHRAVAHNAPTYTPGAEGGWFGDGVDAWVEWHSEGNGAFGLMSAVLPASGGNGWFLTSSSTSTRIGKSTTASGFITGRYGRNAAIAQVLTPVIDETAHYFLVRESGESTRKLYENGEIVAESEDSTVTNMSTGIASFISTIGGTNFDACGVSFMGLGPELPLTPEQVTSLNTIRQKWFNWLAQEQ